MCILNGIIVIIICESTVQGQKQLPDGWRCYFFFSKSHLWTPPLVDRHLSGIGTGINQKKCVRSKIKNKIKTKAGTRKVTLVRIGFFSLVPQISLYTLHNVTFANEMPVSNGLPMTKTLKYVPHVQLRIPGNTDPSENLYIYIFYPSVFLRVVNHFSIIHSYVVVYCNCFIENCAVATILSPGYVIQCNN